MGHRRSLAWWQSNDFLGFPQRESMKAERMSNQRCGSNQRAIKELDMPKWACGMEQLQMCLTSRT